MTRIQYITNLIEEISTKMPITIEHNQKYRNVFALNRNIAGFNEKIKKMVFTLVFSKMDGAYVWDLDGNKYIDISMGFGTHLFGHSSNDIVNNLKEQLDIGFGLGPISEIAGITAQQITELTKVDRVSFFNSGTEAIMVALRLARAFTKKKKIIVFKNSYHGTFDPLLTLKSDKKSKIGIESIPGIHNNLLQDTYFLDYGTGESLEFIKNNHNEIAAVLVEPVQSRNLTLQPFDYLKELRKITEKTNITLIFDEMVTGFRIASGGMQEILDIQADIVTYGKIVGGGMPIGIVAGKSKFLDILDGGFWDYKNNSCPQSYTTFVAGTFCHHPLSMIAANTVLNKIKENKGLYTELNYKTTKFCNETNEILKSLDINIELINFGSLFRFKLNGTNKLLYYELLKNGVYVWEGKSCFLSTCHSQSVLDELKDIIVYSAKRIPHNKVSV